MPVFGQKLDGLCYIAWDTNSDVPKTGDASNHRLKIIRDGLEIVPFNIPVEVDSVGCPGLYKLNLTATEMTGNILTLAGISLTASVVIVPTQLQTITPAVSASVPAQRSGGQIWTDAQLVQWSRDAIGQINIDVNCIFVRECIPITAGVSVYRLPSYVRSVRRVTWRGKSLEAISWDDLTLLTPGTAFLQTGSSANIETSQSRPQWYAFHPTDSYDIRLYPTPNESFTVLGEPNPYAPQVNSPSCIVDFWREPDPNSLTDAISIPPYILRRTQKAYVAWQAFSAEGKGQDLKAAQYYKFKYEFLIEQFRAINQGCFVSKRYMVEDGQTLDGSNIRYPRPLLPTNFENVRF